MKRIWLVVLAVALLVSPVFAAQTTTEIIDTTLTNSVPAKEADSYIGDADKVSFFVTLNSSSTTTGVTANVTVAASIDGIHWQDISWFDVAGGATPQTSETLTSSGTYVMWVDKALTAPYIRVRVNMVNSAVYGVGDTGGISVTVVEKK